jgi:hypothetical protein
MVQASNARTLGRLAGLAYLVIIVFSTAGYLTMTALLDGGAQTVLGRLATDHLRFVLSLTASAIGLLAWIVVGLLIYRLTKETGRVAGLLMLAFVAGGVAMNFAALAQLVPLVTSASVDGARLAPPVASYNRVLLLAQVFSGLWLFPFGWLVFRSRIAPRLLGVCLMLGGFGYLMTFATAFAPDLGQSLAFKLGYVFGAAAMIGEAGICLWLLIMGAREPFAPAPLVRLERPDVGQGRAAESL